MMSVVSTISVVRPLLTSAFCCVLHFVRISINIWVGCGLAQEKMFHLFITVFASVLTILAARTVHAGCVAPVLLQRQQAL